MIAISKGVGRYSGYPSGYFGVGSNDGVAEGVGVLVFTVKVTVCLSA